MKPKIIYDGKSLDGDRPSTFSQDCRQLARTTAIASTVAIALPLGLLRFSRDRCSQFPKMVIWRYHQRDRHAYLKATDKETRNLCARG